MFKYASISSRSSSSKSDLGANEIDIVSVPNEITLEMNQKVNSFRGTVITSHKIIVFLSVIMKSPKNRIFKWDLLLNVTAVSDDMCIVELTL